MPVRVPFHLLRRDEADDCAALLLLSPELSDLLALCGWIGTDPLPPIFPVAGGFLIVPESLPAFLPGCVTRLRRLAENLFVPVDADLVPALHPDEAVDLTRKRGLVFLPHGRCLAFDPERVLDAVAILKVQQPRRDKWQPFPDGEPLADRLATISRIQPEAPPLAVLDAGGEGIGVEQPRPPKAGPVKSAIGKTGMGIGKGLAAIGAALGIGALARLGQKLMGAAMAAVPRLTEKMLGKQEAALRELLRKFREGKTDEALRNALPMGQGRGGVGGVQTSDELPTHNLGYSLGGLIGPDGPSQVWISSDEVQRELMAEYRKAAQRALEHGDHRRAAFIYGRLIGDLHQAADILARGGLHRDAAILYRDVLSKPHFAAREFEAAGEFDEALRLYRQIGDHEAAGDLLRRMGEEERAIEEYHCAATRFGEVQRDYLRAGDLMLRKTGRADLAGAYFAVGWRRRDDSGDHIKNAIPCAARLAEIYAFAEPLESFDELVDEVQGWLSPPGNVARTAEFFNGIARLAELPHLAGHRERLRDRARLALAAKLRDHPLVETRPGNSVSELFGNKGMWSAAVVSDATFALKQALGHQKDRKREERPINTTRLANGTVSAVCFAPQSGDIVVGFSHGQVVSFNPTTDTVSSVAIDGEERIDALAVDASGRMIVAASEVDAGLVLRAYRRDSSNAVQYASKRLYSPPEPGWYHLIPLIHYTGGPQTFLSTSEGLVQLRATAMVCFEHKALFRQHDGPIFLSLQILGRDPRGYDCSIHVGDCEVRWGDACVHTSWRPGIPENSVLTQAPISWLWTGVDCLEIAGLTDEGAIYWSEIFEPKDDVITEPRTYASRRYEGYNAVAIWKAGMLVGVTSQNRVTWLRAGSVGFQEWAAPLAIPFPAKAVGCVPSYSTGEVVVILADGDAVRIPVPA